MMSLSILIILISSINLSIASASQRAKEIGIKKTLGTSRLILQFHYVLEICVLSIIALIFAMIITELVPLFNNYLNTSLQLNNVELLVQVFGLTIVLSIVIGVIYAMYVSNFKTIAVLKGNYSRSRNMIVLRNCMLSLQFVVSGFFLIGGISYLDFNFII